MSSDRGIWSSPIGMSKSRWKTIILITRRDFTRMPVNKHGRGREEVAIYFTSLQKKASSLLDEQHDEGLEAAARKSQCKTATVTSFPRRNVRLSRERNPGGREQQWEWRIRGTRNFRLQRRKICLAFATVWRFPAMPYIVNRIRLREAMQLKGLNGEEAKVRLDLANRKRDASDLRNATFLLILNVKHGWSSTHRNNFVCSPYIFQKIRVSTRDVREKTKVSAEDYS